MPSFGMEEEPLIWEDILMPLLFTLKDLINSRRNHGCPEVLPNKKATHFVDGYKLFRVVYYSERIPKHKFKHPFALICFKVLFSALCILLAQVIFTKN